ncbi:MAG: energy transducer TonB [Chthoniobacterales bacterium]|nr:energy transducer TonB [Chthoniobacterales bacterium]
MAQPQYYTSSPKWQVWASLAGALAIEFAAIGFASLQREEEIPVDPGFVSQQPIDAVITELPPEPTPPPEDEPPPPPPPPDEPTEFTIEEPTPPPRPKDAPTPKPRERVASARPTGPAPTGPVSFISAKANLTSAPRPSYPYEARRARQTGSGKFLLIFNSSGSVTDVQVTQSTGSAILDQTSMQTFRRWRCRPGAYSKVYVPITYTMEGAQL